MAAGDAFSLVPNVVKPLGRKYNNEQTTSDGMKKEYYNLSATPIKKFRLVFNALSATDMGTLRDHYDDQYGGYHNFSWQSVPDYINSGANITGRWVDGSLKREPTGHNRWKCTVDFEKEN
jgi:hypothetical protein